MWIDRYTAERLTNYRYKHAKGYLTSKTGLQLSDFRERLDRESIDKAFKARKVHGDLAEQPPAATPITKAKKAG